MTSLLKNGLGESAVRRQCQALKKVCPLFPVDAYATEALAGIEGMQLKERMLHMVNCLHKYLPRPSLLSSNGLPTISDDKALDFKLHALPILSECAKEGVFPAAHPQDPHPAFAAWPLIDYVGIHGLRCPEESLALLAHLTHLFTAEFAIRPFVVEHFDLTREHALRWCDHSSEHVRRLASEGLRPRLPWGIQLKKLCDDPSPLFPILNKLRSDPSIYVRKSVANNINDISKDHPDSVVELCRVWLEGLDYSGAGCCSKKWTGANIDSSNVSANTKWIIKHGARTLIKEGKPEILSLLGCNVSLDNGSNPSKLVCSKFKLLNNNNSESATITDEVSVEMQRKASTVPVVFVGNSLTIELEVLNEHDELAEKVVIDYAVQYARLDNCDRMKRTTGGKRNRERTSPTVQTTNASVSENQTRQFRKVFKLVSKTLEPKSSLSITKVVPFKPISTRKYFTGKHTIEILLNGKSAGKLDFYLVA